MKIPEGYAHVSQVTLLIESCLDKVNLKMEELDAIAISDGPGSYTGLRVGSSTAKGLCYARDIPLIAISTLDLIAFEQLQNHSSNDTQEAVIAIIDARRDEVYSAAKTGYGQEIFGPKAIIITKGIFDDIQDKYTKLTIVGDATEKCERILDNRAINYVFKHVDARFLSILAFDSYKAQEFKKISAYTPFI